MCQQALHQRHSVGSERLAFVRSTLDLSGEKLLASISIRFICKREI